MTYVDIINAIEVVLWPLLGFIVLARTYKSTPEWRKLGLIAGVVLILFGGSDAVELYTKAWWRPWWLLAWKATCIITLVVCSRVRAIKLKDTQESRAT